MPDPRMPVSRALDHPAAPSKDTARARLEADTEAFLAAGGKVEQVPTGFSNIALARPRSRKQLVLKGSTPIDGKR